MNRSVSTTRLLVMIAALTNPFCWLPFMTAAHSVFVDAKTGELRGTVFVSNADGQRSVVAGAAVTLNGPSSPRHTVTDERGNYNFGAVAAGAYQIEATAPALADSNAVTVTPGKTLNVSVQLKVEAMKQWVTVRSE